MLPIPALNQTSTNKSTIKPQIAPQTTRETLAFLLESLACFLSAYFVPDLQWFLNNLSASEGPATDIASLCHHFHWPAERATVQKSSQPPTLMTNSLPSPCQKNASVSLQLKQQFPKSKFYHSVLLLQS